jgi:hypothetical protein
VTFTRWSNAATTVTAPTVTATNATADAAQAKDQIVFANMAAGEQVSANGLTLVAYKSLTGAEVAQAFFQKINSNYTGDTTGVGSFGSSAWLAGNGSWGVTFNNTITNVTTGAVGVKQKDAVTFVDLGAGGTATAGGLTFTAGDSGATAAEVEAAFAGLDATAGAIGFAAANTAQSLTSTSPGTFTSGSLALNWKATANAGVGVADFEWQVTGVAAAVTASSNVSPTAATLSIWTSATNMGSSKVTELVEGAVAAKQKDAVTFSALTANSSVTVGGLTYTAGANGATAAQVATAFQGLDSTGADRKSVV